MRARACVCVRVWAYICIICIHIYIMSVYLYIYTCQHLHLHLFKPKIHRNQFHDCQLLSLQKASILIRIQLFIKSTLQVKFTQNELYKSKVYSFMSLIECIYQYDLYFIKIQNFSLIRKLSLFPSILTIPKSTIFWLLYFTIMTLRFMHISVCINNSFLLFTFIILLNSIPPSKYTIFIITIHIQIEIRLLSNFS